MSFEKLKISIVRVILEKIPREGEKIFHKSKKYTTWKRVVLKWLKKIFYLKLKRKKTNWSKKESQRKRKLPTLEWEDLS